MSHSLKIEVPEHIYDSVLKESQQTGQPLEEVIVEWLSTVAQFITDDPIEQFIGALDSGVPDLAAQHDNYIGEALGRVLKSNGTDDQARK